MMIMTRRSSPSVLAGLALGALLSGCASSAKSEPPAASPSTLAASTAPPPEARLTVASRDDDDKRVVASGREREIFAAEPLTMKGFKPFERSTKTTLDAPGRSSGASAIVGALPAVAVPIPAVYAERRASEALDRLAGVVAIRHEKRGAVITLSSDKLVDSGQWALTSSGQYSLRELAIGLRDQDGHTIFIQAYTDSMGSSAVNDALSLRRAEAVRDYLSTLGVPADSMRAEGLGAKRPVAGNGTAEGRAQNRRIEIVVAP